MNLNKDDSIYKRPWIRKEHDALVQMTNDFEAGGLSGTVSWTDHWMKVSLYLKEQGYSRTHNACQAYWRRIAKFNGEGVDVRLGSPESCGTAGSASSSPDDPYSRKRHLLQEVDNSSEEGTAMPCKKPRAGETWVQDAVGSGHVRFEITLAAHLPLFGDLLQLIF